MHKDLHLTQILPPFNVLILRGQPPADDPVFMRSRPIFDIFQVHNRLVPLLGPAVGRPKAEASCLMGPIIC
jgi:hypothetical protein